MTAEGYSIVIVDDLKSEELAMAIRRLVGPVGINVVPFNTPMDALEYFRCRIPDIVLLDLDFSGGRLDEPWASRSRERLGFLIAAELHHCAKAADRADFELAFFTGNVENNSLLAELSGNPFHDPDGTAHGPFLRIWDKGKPQAVNEGTRELLAALIGRRIRRGEIECPESSDEVRKLVEQVEERIASNSRELAGFTARLEAWIVVAQSRLKERGLRPKYQNWHDIRRSRSTEEVKRQLAKNAYWDEGSRAFLLEFVGELAPATYQPVRGRGCPARC